MDPQGETLERLKLPGSLSGVAGQYFVPGELCRGGYVAAITLRNTRGIDILASNASASRSVGIQVKTNQVVRNGWMLNEKAEAYFADDLFYVFVKLRSGSELPEFYVVPSKVVANQVKRETADWIKTTNKRGQPHRKTSIRKFVDRERQYRDRWDLLLL